MALFGTAVVTCDGQELPTIEGTATLTLGLKTGKARKSPRGFLGASSIVNLSTLKVDVNATDDFDPEAFEAPKEVSCRFTDIDGVKKYVIAKMVMTADPELSDGEDSKWTINFEGSKAEKV